MLNSHRKHNPKFRFSHGLGLGLPQPHHHLYRIAWAEAETGISHSLLFCYLALMMGGEATRSLLLQETRQWLLSLPGQGRIRSSTLRYTMLCGLW
jgi:hypothetical protein